MQTRRISALASLLVLTTLLWTGVSQADQEPVNLKLDGPGRIIAPGTIRSETSTSPVPQPSDDTRSTKAGARKRLRDILTTYVQAAQQNRRRSHRGGRSPASGTPRPTEPKRLVSACPVTAAGDWRALVAQCPWDTAVANRIVMCESDGIPTNRNPSGATGLFQILGGPTDPVANVAQAYQMYVQRGWQPWDASRSCWAG